MFDNVQNIQAEAFTIPVIASTKCYDMLDGLLYLPRKWRMKWETLIVNTTVQINNDAQRTAAHGIKKSAECWRCI